MVSCRITHCKVVVEFQENTLILNLTYLKNSLFSFFLPASEKKGSANSVTVCTLRDLPFQDFPHIDLSKP